MRRSDVPVQERAAVQRLFHGCLGHGNIPDCQNRKAASCKNERKKNKGGQEF